MTMGDYSGVRSDGRWLEPAGWSLLGLGLLCTFAGALVLAMPLLYGLALGGM